MSGSVALRAFHSHDLEDVHALVSRTIDESYPPFYSPLVISFFKKYHQKERILHDADRGWTVVLEDQGRILATGTLVGTNIRRVFVHPGCQRRGYGKLIMHELERIAVKRGLKFVDLDASLFAKNFYLDLHYVIMKHGTYPLTKDDLLGYYKMAKSFLPSNTARWDLDNTRFRFTGSDGSQRGLIEGIEFEFVQKGNLVYGGYQGEKSEFGEIIGLLDGDMIEFSTMHEHSDGTTDHGKITGVIGRDPGGKIRLIDTQERRDICVMEEV